MFRVILGPLRPGKPVPQAVELEIGGYGNDPGTEEEKYAKPEDPPPRTEMCPAPRRRRDDGLRDGRDEAEDGDDEEDGVFDETRDVVGALEDFELGVELVRNADVLGCKARGCGQYPWHSRRAGHACREARVVTLGEHDAREAEGDDDEDGAGRPEEPVGKVSVDDGEGGHVRDERHEDEVADDVVVVGGDAAAEKELNGDEHGKPGDELLVAEAEDGCFEDFSGPC